MRYFESAEGVFERFVEERVRNTTSPDAHKYFDERICLFDSEQGMLLRANIESINSKLSALLTLISAMIAALGIILIVFDESKITQFFIFVEIISYAILAIVCVYSLRYKGGASPINEEFETLEGYYSRYLNRRYVFVLCTEGVIITTVVFLLTILIHLAALIF